MNDPPESDQDDRTRLRPARPVNPAPGPAPATTGTGRSGSSSWTDPSEWEEQSAQSVQPGAVLKGRFVLEEIVGRGGMGVVFRARDLRKEEAQDRDPFVAIKILNDEFRRHPESLKALQREARKAQSLAHPNIATVFDFDRDGATVYLQMEFLDGDPLDKLVKTRSVSGLPYQEAYPLIAGLGRALSYAHGKGIVHSDFKPGNCFLTKSGVIKVFDFGIARAAKLPGMQQGDLTRFDPGTLGALTPAYASCEMIEGEEPDPRDDIYALGCVAYELLTGRHPFDRKPASEAREAGLVPAPVKGLNQRQFRALQKALAFRRKQRSASVADFLEALGERKLNKTVIASAVAAAGALAVAGFTFLPSYLQGRQIEELVAALSSGTDERIAAAIEEYRGLTAVVQNSVLQASRDPLLEYFGERVAAAVDPSQDRFDYPLAESILATAQSLIQDSAILSQLEAALESEKADLLLQMRTRFNEHLTANSLLPVDGPDNDVVDVLEIVAQASPYDPLLQDPQLVLAYADGAQSALENEDLAAAQSLIDIGLGRYPADARLANLRDDLNVELESAAVTVRLAELREELDVLPTLDSIAELRGIDHLIVELDSLLAGRNDPLLDAFREQFASLLEVELSNLADARDWAAADELIAEVANLLTDDALLSSRGLVADARTAYEQRRDALVDELNASAGEGRMDDAVAALGALDDLQADTAVLRRARASIEQGYVRSARDARAASRFDEAAQMVSSGMTFAPESSVLPRERDAIEAARQLADAQDSEAAAQMAGEAQGYRDTIESALAQRTLEVDAAARLLDAVDELALRAPADPMVRGGRGEVAARLAFEASNLAADDRYDEALAVLDAAIDMVSEASLLRSAREQTLQAKSEYLAGERQDEFAAQRVALASLLDTPGFDADWEARVRESLASLGRVLPAGDTTVPQARVTVGEMYVARAARMRGQERLAEAERLLGIASGFAPRLDTLALEQQAVAEARRTLEADNAERARVAQIEGLQQTFLTAANADNIERARSTLSTLRASLPAGDEFLTTTAPGELGGILLRQARAAFGESRLDDAERLAEEGIDEAPDLAALRELLVEVRAARSGASPAVTASPTATRPVGQECTATLAGFGSRGSRGQCWDMVDSENQGPRLVVLPPGEGFAAPFAIGRYEIAVGRWNAYCRSSGQCEERGGNETDPLTNISLQEARDYAGWLSALTGSTYRLPTSLEWEYAASAPRDGRNDDNCVVEAAGRGGVPRSVTQGQQNAWGLVNYQGNVQEWIETGSAIEARGGTYRDSLDACTFKLGNSHNGEADSVTGFRLVREL